jgi:hypothetical protein
MHACVRTQRCRAPLCTTAAAFCAGGNGEQSISRDVNRLGDRLDWFRLMSWYHSGIGFFINSTLTMASVYLAVWLVFFFSLTDSLTVRAGKADQANALRNEGDLISTINTVQLGLLSVIPYWGELCLETGFLTVRSRLGVCVWGASLSARCVLAAACSVREWEHGSMQCEGVGAWQHAV